MPGKPYDPAARREQYLRERAAKRRRDFSSDYDADQGIEFGNCQIVRRACKRWERDNGLVPSNPLTTKQQSFYAAQHNTKNTKTN